MRLRDDRAYLIAEIGINHNGSYSTARELIKVAFEAGFDAVKFQIRTPELCVPQADWDKPRDTPWGQMGTLEYRRRIELPMDQHEALRDLAHGLGIDWFASCWDAQAVLSVAKLEPDAWKVASASLTEHGLIRQMCSYDDKPVILSTGMSTREQIDNAASCIPAARLIVLHATSVYPCMEQEINLRCMEKLRAEYDVVGYSGHERGIAISVAAVAMGARVIERHVTLDRTMKGSDHAASLEPGGMRRLVRDIRAVEAAMGDGVKRVYESELPAMRKLRRVQ